MKQNPYFSFCKILFVENFKEHLELTSDIFKCMVRMVYIAEFNEYLLEILTTNYFFALICSSYNILCNCQ